MMEDTAGEGGGRGVGGNQRSGNCARMFATYVATSYVAMAAATVTRSAWSDGGVSVPGIPVSGLVPRR